MPSSLATWRTPLARSCLTRGRLDCGIGRGRLQANSGENSMSDPSHLEITLDMMRQRLTCPVVCDALDAVGRGHQSPRVPIRPLTSSTLLVGRCKTTLWADMAHDDPKPYALEL